MIKKMLVKPMKLHGNIFLSTIVLLALLKITAFAATDKNAEYYFETGIEKYINEDLTAAIENLEQAYRLKRKDKTRQILVKALMEKGEIEFSNKNFSKALQCFSRILALEPGNSKASNFYGILTAKKKTAAAKRIVRKPSKKKLEKKNTHSNETVTLLPKEYDAAPQAIVAEKHSEKIYIWIIIIAIAIFIFLIYSFFYFKKIFMLGYESMHQPIKKIPSLKKLATKIPVKIHEYAKNKTSSSTEIRYFPGGARDMLECSNAHVRARGVELIVEEMKDCHPEVIERVLYPCLKDTDSRVRANAAKEVYKFDSGLAMETLQSMTKSPNKWMRLSAAWALEQIGTQETIDELWLMIEDEDPDVQKRVAEYFRDSQK